ncbi:MAG: glycosyltransferase [Candidatus Rokuibacteriota bacterium]
MADAVSVLQLLVSTRLGGGPKQVFETLRHVPREHFEWVLAAPDDGPYFPRFGEIGTVHRLGLDRLRPTTFLDLVRLIRTRRIDVVHSHGKGPGLYGRLAARVTGRPAIHTFHGIHVEKYAAPAARLYLTLERALARLSYAIVNVSESEARAGESLRLWPAGRALVIHNGIDTAATRALARQQSLSRGALGMTGAGPLVASIARLDSVKGVDIFVRAVAALAERHPSVQALVVGTGREEARLRALAAETGTERRLRFVGEIPDAVRIFPAVDVYVSASRGEGLPLAVLEAMACDVPVVATRIPAHEELIVDGRTGLLARPDDPADLAEKTSRLLRDGDLGARLRACARDDIDRRYDVATTAAALAALYRKAREERLGPCPLG